MKNRFMLAPMTNQQSGEDGRISAQELNWLRARAVGGFGLVSTCACHVHEGGKGFPGELGIFSDTHIPGLTELATAIREHGGLSAVQLYHGGSRASVQNRIGPTADGTGAREMTRAEVRETVQHFGRSAERAQAAGFDGVELHGAHGYLISQFLSKAINRRSDEYGGLNLQNRSRFLIEIIEEIRLRCGDTIQLGVRLSPERFGQDLADVVAVTRQLFSNALIDYVDLSLWDVFKEPEDGAYRGRSLLSYFTELDRGNVRLGVAGKLIQPQDILQCFETDVDFVALGKVAVLHANYPARMQADPEFAANWLPVTEEYLRQQALGDRFITYLSTWTNFASDRAPPSSVPRFDIEEYLKKGMSEKVVR